MTSVETHLVPRWGGDATSDWYPEAKRRGVVDTFVPMPNPSLPEIGAWTDHLRAHILAAGVPARTLKVITHSIACHATMRAIETLPEDQVIAEVTMVAGWWDIDRGFWESIDFDWAWLEPWIGYPLDLAAVRARIGRWRIVLGTEDMLCPDYLENAKRWLQAGVDSVTVMRGKGHFNGGEDAELFEVLAG